MDVDRRRRYVAVAGKPSVSERVSTDINALDAKLVSVQGVEEVRVVNSKRREVQPWRLSRDPARAALLMLIVGVGYLL